MKKIGFNIGRQSCERIMEEIHPCRTSCMLKDALNSRPRLWPLIKFKYLSEKLPLSQKLRYLRGNRFSQCFILSTALNARYQVSLYTTNLNNQ